MRRFWGGALALLWAQVAGAASISTITASGAENGTTLPFQRHIIRLGDPTPGNGIYFAAIQKQKVDGEGLVFYSSTDGGDSWDHNLPIQNNPAIRDTADMLPDDNGQGFSLIYGVEPVSSNFVVDSRTDVVFLHYKLASDYSLSVDVGPITLWHPQANQGWYRPSITRDSAGTLHATASLIDTSSGSNVFTFWERMSIDGGNEWTQPTQIAAFGNSFGGGRLVPYGSRVMAIYDAYRPDDPGRYRTKDAGPCSDWSSEVAFADNGLYHAGAFSVTSTPDGHVHLGHSDKNNQQLWYREFDGTQWLPAIKIDGNGYWTNQPALAHQGNNVIYSWNHFITETNMVMYTKVRTSGTWGSRILIDDTVAFKGYTAGNEVILPGEDVHVLWGQFPAGLTDGQANVRDAAVTLP